jgi:hypothetical protein
MVNEKKITYNKNRISVIVLAVKVPVLCSGKSYSLEQDVFSLKRRFKEL